MHLNNRIRILIAIKTTIFSANLLIVKANLSKTNGNTRNNVVGNTSII